MKQLLVVTLFFLGCNRQANDFEKYISQLEKLSTPISFETIRYPELQTSRNYDSNLFKKYSPDNADAAYGKLYEDQNSIGIIYTITGDISVPVLVTYDKEGNKIDSMNLFENASGFGFESETYEYVTFFPDKIIQVIDSTKKWSVDSLGERIDQSEKLSIDTIIHFINNNGKIIRDKN